MKKLIMPFLLAVVLLACKDHQKKDASPMVKTATKSADNKPMQSEFADAKFTDMGKQMLREFEAGNIDQWVNHFADNAVYTWSSGDSLAGKQAISGYWKKRRMDVVDSMRISNDIWLPIKVNTPQRGPDVPGVWLLNWHQVNVRYKNGKSLQFWVHADYHFNAADKVDRMVSYVDRAPINAAVGAQAMAGMKPGATK